MIDSCPINKLRMDILDKVHASLEKTSRDVLYKPMTIEKILAGMRLIYEFPQEIADARERAASNYWIG